MDIIRYLFHTFSSIGMVQRTRIYRAKGTTTNRAIGPNINKGHGDIPLYRGYSGKIFLEGLMHVILSPWGHPPISGTSGDKN
jgi:hypothetical protein